MTTDAFTFGGNDQDLIVDIDVDSLGYLYACGHSLSTGYTSGD
jgi:hypothetical protein